MAASVSSNPQAHFFSNSLISLSLSQTIGVAGFPSVNLLSGFKHRVASSRLPIQRPIAFVEAVELNICATVGAIPEPATVIVPVGGTCLA
jgi:hypothetical protein